MLGHTRDDRIGKDPGQELFLRKREVEKEHSGVALGLRLLDYVGHTRTWPPRMSHRGGIKGHWVQKKQRFGMSAAHRHVDRMVTRQRITCKLALEQAGMGACADTRDSRSSMRPANC